MIIKLFNFWYFFWIILETGMFLGLYFLLRNRSVNVQKWTLFSILAIALIMHFTKVFYPPYSTDEARCLRDSWFVNICGANIALFPFIFLSKNKYAKDYMFYIGVLSGIIATLYPTEPIDKANQLGEQLDIIRFYLHHGFLWMVPLLMVIFRLHEIDYHRILSAPIGLLVILLFVILNQVFQAELGFIPQRNDDFFDVNWKNTSWIWGPDDSIGELLAIFCPKFFTIVPIGEHAGETKYWPWFWLIFPVFILVTPAAFGLSMIFERKHFASDMKILIEKAKGYVSMWKGKFPHKEEEKEDSFEEKSDDTIL